MSSTFKERDKARCFWCVGAVPGSENDTVGHSGHLQHCTLYICGSGASPLEQSRAHWLTCEWGTSPSSWLTSPPRTPPLFALRWTQTWAWSQMVDRFLRCGCTTGCVWVAQEPRCLATGKGRSWPAPPPICRWPPGPSHPQAAQPATPKHLSEALPNNPQRKDGGVRVYWLWRVSGRSGTAPPWWCGRSTEGSPCAEDLEAGWWLWTPGTY